MQCSGPKQETQRFAEVTDEQEFGNGERPSQWLSVLVPVTRNKVEVGASPSVPDFPPAHCFLFHSGRAKWRGRVSSKQGWDGLGIGEGDTGPSLEGVLWAEGVMFLAWGVAGWGSSPGAECSGRSHPLHDGREFRSVPILGDEQMTWECWWTTG